MPLRRAFTCQDRPNIDSRLQKYPINLELRLTLALTQLLLHGYFPMHIMVTALLGPPEGGLTLATYSQAPPR